MTTTTAAAARIAANDTTAGGLEMQTCLKPWYVLFLSFFFSNLLITIVFYVDYAYGLHHHHGIQ